MLQLLGILLYTKQSNAYAGAHIQDGMEKKVKELGIDVRTGTKLSLIHI